MVNLDLDEFEEEVEEIETHAEKVADAKNAAIAKINELVSNYPKSNYTSTDWAILLDYVDDEKALINSYTDIDVINAYTINSLQENIEAVKTRTEEEKAEALATAKENALAAIEALAASYVKADYRDAEWAVIQALISSEKTAINESTTAADLEDYTVEDLASSLSAVKTTETLLAEELDVAKKNALAAVDDLAASYVKADYRDAEWTAIQALISAENKKINDLTTIDNLIGYTTEGLASSLSAVKTNETLLAEELDAAKKNALSAVDDLAGNYDKADYRDAQWAMIQSMLTSEREKINGSKTAVDLKDYSTAGLAITLSAVKTNETLLAEELDAAKKNALAAVDDLAGNYAKADYRDAEWKSIQNLINEVKTVISNCKTAADLEDYTTEGLASSLSAVKTNKALLAEELDAAKLTKCNEIDNLINLYNEADYSSSKWQQIESDLSDFKAIVNAYVNISDVNDFDIEIVKVLISNIEKAKVFVGTIGYDTVQEAITATTTGTIVLHENQDCTAGLTVALGKVITLDLNGKTLEVNNGTGNIKVYGKLILMDSVVGSTGKIYSTSAYVEAVYASGMITVYSNASFVMNSGLIETKLTNPKDNGNFGVYASGENPSVTINGGTIDVGWYAVATNGTYTTNAVIAINSGKLVSQSDYAIYMPSTGTVTIDDGIIDGAAGAVCMNGGSLTINGGTLQSNGTGDTGEWSDGTGYGINAVLNINKKYSDVTVTITGGTFASIENIVVGNNTHKLTMTITGGQFSSDISQYLAEGYYQLGQNVVSTATVAIGHKAYSTIEEAIASVNDGQTIILLDDISGVDTTGKYVGDLNILSTTKSYDFTLDLNNHAISREIYFGNTIDKAYSSFSTNITIKNGTVGLNNSDCYYGLIVNGNENINVVIENVTLIGYYAGLYTNGSTAGATITVTNSTLKGMFDDDSAGAYLAANDTYTFTNCTFSGNTGILTKSGVHVYKNCTIIATGVYATPTYNGNGGNCTGCGLEVQPTVGYGQTLDITYNGGSISSKNGYAVEEGAFASSGKTPVAYSATTISAATTLTSGKDTLVNSQNNDVQISVSNYSELQKAIASGAVVKLIANIEVSSTITITNSVVFEGDYTIKAGDTFTDTNLFVVGTSNVVVTFKDVTLNANSKCRVIACSAGKIVIAGATVTGGYLASSYASGIFMTNSSSFEMTSGTITGNISGLTDYYAVYSQDLWIGANATGSITSITGGTVGYAFVNANSYSANNAGGFTLDGGHINNIYVEYDSGYGATFTFTSGQIDNLYVSTKTSGTSVATTPTTGTVYKGGVEETSK